MQKINKIRIILSILLLMVLKAGWSEAPTPRPVEILIGAYPVMLRNFDYSQGTFAISFYLWTITNDKNYSPEKSLEITNSFEYKIQNIAKDINPDGRYYTFIHYYATIQYDWDIANFPFDRQLLRVDFEDADGIERILFKPDKNESQLYPTLNIPGWDIQNFYVDVVKNSYSSKMGDEAASGVYSKFSFFIEIKRHGLRLFLNYFIGFIVSFFLASLIFFIKPQAISNRISLSLSSLFASIGNKYILDNLLPPTNKFTLIDAAQVMVFSLFLIAIFTSILVFEMTEKGHTELACKTNRYIRNICIPCFALFFLFFLIKALLY